jgi:hypothetical protein
MAQGEEPAVVETMRTAKGNLTTPGVTAVVLAYINWRLTGLGGQARWSRQTIEWANWVCKPPGGDPKPEPWPPPQPGEEFMRDVTCNVMGPP